MRSAIATLARLSSVPVAVTALTLSLPTVASAHTDFEFSVPEDGAAVGEPVGEVTVAFTQPVTLVGNGFEVLAPTGNVIEPEPITDDATVFRLQFDPPLAGGVVGVRYEVTAADGHVLSGAFSFAVEAELPPSTTAVTATPTGPVSPPATESAEPITAAPSTSVTAPATVDEAPLEEAVDVEPAADRTASEENVSSPTEPDDDGGPGSGVYIALAAALAVGAGGFLVLRSRTSG